MHEFTYIAYMFPPTEFVSDLVNSDMDALTSSIQPLILCTAADIPACSFKIITVVPSVDYRLETHVNLTQKG